MRGSLTISAIVHVVVLGMCLVAFAAQPMEVPATPAMTVNTISVKDFTELTKGVKDAPKLKVDDIKPVADKIDTPKPVDEVAPKAVDKKPEIKTDTSAKQQPKPDNKPDNKPDPKPADKPAKAKPPDYKPDKIADLLKKDAAKPPKPDDKASPDTPPRDSPKFNADQVAALLDKRDPQRQMAAAETLNNQPNLGASNWRRGAIVAKRNRRAARAHFQLLEPAARHHRVDENLCRAPRAVQTGRLDVAGAGAGRGHGVGARTGAGGERQARAAAVPAVHHAQARALRPMERPRAQIRSARAARRLRH